MFSEQDLSMLRIIECLKCTGMSIKDIRQYAVWAQMGDSTLEQRYNLFLERREAVMAQIKELEDQLKVIDYKCQYYEEAIAAGTEDIHKHKTGHCCDDEKENKDA